ncbi:hypothetical protein SAMN05421823_109137 [Catalinimonas alkaloidigena]|uniref:Serine aminopeptidase S33 domain-containing protein n=1 Tax=Catalinimonas alkaloidigena TaxID=1075417 RepID=A0A1G9PCP3_9BACT|nr:alpha/beta hydrolase [Catalinimonas alkaloidigena]SDL95915.1 hypothetical protein SAMN05421823_109137 [Catalinimonas alkaloidigena]
MKTFFLYLLLVGVLVETTWAQDLTGTWQGALSVQGQSLPLVVHLKPVDGGYTGTLDSPKQNAFGLAISSVELNQKRLTLGLTALGASYEGTLVTADSLAGTWKQGGASFPLNLKRTDTEVGESRKPQEPKPPFLYESKDVSFQNAVAHLQLAGTLTLPKGAGPFPAVVLVSGSGPQNRDEEIFGHKPFAVLADYLTRHNIAVLRYDDRGQGQSQGDFATATTEDFATDAAAAFAFLKQQAKIDPTRVGIVGHSEGGLIAPMLAAQDTTVAFLVLLAAPGVATDDLMLQQSILISEASGAAPQEIEQQVQLNRQLFNILKSNDEPEALLEQMTELVDAEAKRRAGGDEATEAALKQQMTRALAPTMSPWFRYFINLNPRPTLMQVTCPVLALNGEKDLQVPAGPNLKALADALKSSGNTRVTTRELPGLNHLFQTAQTGLPAEYGQLEETFAPVALETIADWINGLAQQTYGVKE